MYETDDIEVWNLSPGGVARCDAVSIFNVVGALKRPKEIREAHYSLNAGPEKPVFFERGKTTLRLGPPGEFNIDTIMSSSLREQNLLRFRILRTAGRTGIHELNFGARPFLDPSPRFKLDLSCPSNAEEVGQVVDGPWRVAEDDGGRRCLEIRPEEAGYDRIILFGRHDWTTGYELFARFSVTALTGMHNVGLIFKWNPHKQGDGTWLPSQWSTGLGYYCSYGEPGVRIRFGVDVHRTEAGEKVGDYLLGHAHLNRLRYRRTWLVSKFWRRGQPSELKLYQDYLCRLRVHPDQYALTMWRPGASGMATDEDRGEPVPQVIVDEPSDLLPRGSVGVIAHQVGIRLYEFEARPID
jgi:hypothetical protein